MDEDIPGLPGTPRQSHDLTATVKALARLDGEYLAAFFQSIPATVWMTDEHLTLTFLQGSLLQRLNIDSGRVIGRTLAQVLMGGREDHPIIQGHITALAGHETIVRVEWGTTLYHARIAPLRDASGAIVGCAGVQQAIGWMPDEEGTLRENDIRLRRVIDSNMIGLAFGNDEGRITDANEAFLELAGYTREDLVADGISWPALTPIDSHQRQLDALEELRETGRCTPFEIDLIRRDGQPVPVMVGGARMSASRREGVAFVLDISDRKRIQHRLEGELACADALADAATVDAAAPMILETLTGPLGWRAAALWLQRDGSPPTRIASRGLEGADRSLDELGERTAHADGPVWAADVEVFSAPLTAGGTRLGALVLVGRRERPADDDGLATCRRIADRIARKAARSA